ncbi:MAG: GTP-sensing pleiotropic transcriptional regulator CodY [Lachnospiraceae bacterium]|nr:GTP-sensing pleiotropic transcriptional regulator CodY [Lachnospiraceae bacterium]
MSVILLDRIRRINNLLHDKSNAEKVVFTDICSVLGNILDANVYVTSRKGKVLGLSVQPDVAVLPSLLSNEIGQYLAPVLNERMLNILSTKENINLPMLGFEEPEAENLIGIACPIDIAGERHGSLFLYRKDKMFNIDDIILCEYTVTVIGLEIMRSVNEENAEEDRSRQTVLGAVNSLSYSELRAVREVARRLPGIEGLLVASKIADEIDITRSIIVNALRKLASAGIIDARSSGMKGTYVKLNNPYFLDILEAVGEEEDEKQRRTKENKD